MAANIEQIVRKYTGREIAIREVYEANEQLAELIAETVRDIQTTEAALARTVRSLRETADRIEQVLAAGPEDRVAQLNPHGELQGDNPDRLIALRHQQIEHLQRIVYGLLPEA